MLLLPSLDELNKIRSAGGCAQEANSAAIKMYIDLDMVTSIKNEL